MTNAEDQASVARRVIDGNRYMVLGTADEDGRPWATPVFYAADGYATFYWVSSPDVTHSGNLTRRPEVSIVIFDSQTPVGTARETSVFMAGTAEQVADDEIERCLGIYPGPPERGARSMEPHELRAPGPMRLYRATVAQHWMLCPMTTRPCTAHGLEVDHRTEVVL